MNAKTPKIRRLARASTASLSVGDPKIAERLYDDHHADILFDVEAGWRVFESGRFVLDKKNRLLTRAEQTLRAMVADAVRLPEGPEQDRELEEALTYSKHRNLRGALEFLKPRVAVRADELDREPHLLNVLNGTVDLHPGGSLRAHDRQDRITKIIPVKYDPEARAPRWYQFLLEVFPGGLESGLIDYIQRLVGYSFTAEQTEHIIAILWGAGGNGKSKFVDVLLALAGEYGQSAPASLLMKRYGDAIPTDVARLRGARLVVASESTEGARLDEERVKVLTGGDRQVGRFMYRDFFEFSPTHHLYLQTNHKPRISGMEHAIWRRIRLIPFEVQFDDPKENPETEHPRDDRLEEKLLAELPGILAWVVDGARCWYESGLNEPEVVREATKQYRREQDILTDFIEDCCVVGTGYTVAIGSLYKRYREWCEADGAKPWSKNLFARRLGDMGYEGGRTEEGDPARIRKGLTLRG